VLLGNVLLACCKGACFDVECAVCTHAVAVVSMCFVRVRCEQGVCDETALHFYPVSCCWLMLTIS
jgi:hypothetical protein